MPNLTNPMVPQELLIAGTALKSGIFDALNKKPVSLDELASELSMNYRALWTVIEALIFFGYVRREEDLLHLTTEAEGMFFNVNSGNHIGYSLIHTFNVIRAWTALPEILKTGEPPARLRTDLDIKGFMAAMEKNTAEISADLVALSLAGLGENPVVLDLGGGPLNFARPFASAGASVTVQDTPEVCAVMSPSVKKSEKIKFYPGDFMESVCPGKFDLVFMGNISHIYGKEENIRLFNSVHEVLRPGGRIAILDFVRGESPFAIIFAVNMLANTKTGGTWTLEQYTGWLNVSGYNNIELHKTGNGHIITAVSI